MYNVFTIGWPYAAKAIIQHEFDTDHLNIWITFQQPMYILSAPDIAKWLVYADDVLSPATAAEWQDEYTLLLTVPDIIANPARLLLKYDGPDEGLCMNWNKQIEPWGKILSLDISS